MRSMKSITGRVKLNLMAVQNIVSDFVHNSKSLKSFVIDVHRIHNSELALTPNLSIPETPSAVSGFG